MAGDIDWPYIARYLGDDCSEQERRAIEARAMADPTWRDAIAAARAIWASAAPQPDHWNTPAAWEEVVRKAAEAGQASAAVRPPRSLPFRVVASPPERRPRRRGILSGMAAAAAAVALLGVTRWSHLASRATASRLAIASMYTVVTKPSQRVDLRMPDGTRIVLGAASTLRYPRTFGESQRQVYLDGQAYFEVAHDAAKPFTVYARNAVARDLGTRFDVRAYREDDAVEVAVAEGKVELASTTRQAPAGRDRVVLTRGQLGRVGAAGMVTASVSTDLDQRFAWVNGRLVFKDVALHDLLPQLSRWYDVEFRLGDAKLGDRRLTGTFQDESVLAVLQFLTLSLDARYSQDGRIVTLIPNRVPR